jgi:hypothetical protein
MRVNMLAMMKSSILMSIGVFNHAWLFVIASPLPAPSLLLGINHIKINSCLRLSFIVHHHQAIRRKRIYIYIYIYIEREREREREREG